jgi:hypothetical protein
MSSLFGNETALRSPRRPPAPTLAGLLPRSDGLAFFGTLHEVPGNRLSPLAATRSDQCWVSVAVLPSALILPAVPRPPRNSTIQFGRALGQHFRAIHAERRCRVSRNVSDVAESVENPFRLKEMPIVGATHNLYGVKTSRSALTRGFRLFKQGTAMTTLIEQIETMRVRMNAMATEEYGLVRTLDDQHLASAAPYYGHWCDLSFEAGGAALDHFAPEAIAGRNHATHSRLGRFAESLSRPFSHGVSRVFWASRKK